MPRLNPNGNTYLLKIWTSRKSRCMSVSGILPKEWKHVYVKVLEKSDNKVVLVITPAKPEADLTIDMTK